MNILRTGNYMCNDLVVIRKFCQLKKGIMELAEKMPGEKSGMSHKRSR